MKKTIIGIDPGFTGAIAFLNSKLLYINDLPIHEIMERKEIDGEILSAYLDQEPYYSLAVLEDVSAMPGQGVTSMFRFGFATGVILGVLNAHQIPVLRIKSNVWKPALGLSRDKKKSLALARKTFPGYEHYFKRAKDDGRAEAALMAYYVREHF